MRIECLFTNRDLSTSSFEVVLTMEGITPETGNTIQVKMVQAFFPSPTCSH